MEELKYLEEQMAVSTLKSILNCRHKSHEVRRGSSVIGNTGVPRKYTSGSARVVSGAATGAATSGRCRNIL